MFGDNQPSARLIGAALVGVMVFGTALGAEATTKKKVVKKPVKHTRTVTLPYKGGCTLETPAVTASPGACTTIGSAGYLLDARAGEKFVSVTVTDATGRKVPGQFWETGGGTVPNDTEISFCGSMKNFQFPAGQQIQLDLDALGAVTSCPGIATQGTVKLVFSNLP